MRSSRSGLGIHFLHVRSPREDGLPLVITHGWPGSIVEFGKVIGPLTAPGAHGGDAADAFHVVCPALPGYGFSGKPSRPGWGTEHTGDAWDQLMTRLGYPRYACATGTSRPRAATSPRSSSLRRSWTRYAPHSALSGHDRSNSETVRSGQRD